MDILGENKKIFFLITKQLCEGLEVKEEQELRAWRASSPECEVLYQKLLNRENLSNYVKKREKIDLKKYQELYKQHLSKEKRIGFYWRWVAVVFVLLGLGVSLWFVSWHEETEVSVLVQNDIKPGVTKAMLFLENGEEIVLDESESVDTLWNNGSAIRKDSKSIKYLQTPVTQKEELMNKIVIPTGGEYNLILSDGTRVYLNAESELIFPKQFIGNKRVVLLKGEAYFQVQASEKTPFVVQTESMDVVVSGTEFNIKAYTDEDKVQTTLLQGRVTIYGGENKSEKIKIEPNQQVEWECKTKKIKVKEVNPNLFVAWKNGQFIFHQERLENIMKTLARWYDVEVIYRKEEIKEMYFAGKLDRSESIMPILDVLRATDKLTVEINKKQIILDLK